MRFLFIAGREISYPRNDVMIRALKRLGDVDVVGSKERGSILFRSLSVTLKLILSRRSREYDLVFVGFFGQLLMFPISIWSPSPIVFDAFISTYDTLCFDRKMFSPNSILGRMAYWLDVSACERSNLILLDTWQHLRYFQEIFTLPEPLFLVVPVSCNEDLFYPREDSRTFDHRILFYSTYLPVHGVETILHAIALLNSTENLKFRLLGDGPGLKQAKRLANVIGLKNVTFLPYLPISELAEEVALAGICLGGHFGKTDKADRVVPTKIYQMMAMAKPMIVGDTSANRDLLKHGESALLCPPADPASLADAIRVLQKDPPLRKKLGTGARERFDQVCSEEAITKQLGEIIKKVSNG
jgi:glycosyltransferase involved in cell wall biosynthesis